MSQEQLAEAIREEKMPRVCYLHPEKVYYDGPVCPACEGEKELAPDCLYW